MWYPNGGGLKVWNVGVFAQNPITQSLTWPPESMLFDYLPESIDRILAMVVIYWLFSMNTPAAVLVMSVEEIMLALRGKLPIRWQRIVDHSKRGFAAH